MEIKRKGIIFALDAALAVAVVIIILINSSYYFSTSSKESLSQLQPVRIGSDVMALLDFGGNFDHAFATNSEDHFDTIPQPNLNVSSYVPKNYAMRYAISDMKRTLTTTDNCPASGGGLGAGGNCETHTSVTCDATGCTLPQNAWLRIKPVTKQDVTTWRADIRNPGKHFIAFDTTRTSSDLSVILDVDGISTTLVVSFDADTGIFIWGSDQIVPSFEAGNPPSSNWIKITNLESQTLTVNWVRVIGDESYMRGAYSEPGITALPIDRFIGTGERFITILEPDGDFEGYHLARYWIWLKTVST